MARKLPPNSPRGTPARVLVLFGLLLAAVAVFTWRQRGLYPADIRIVLPTGAGDAVFLPATATPIQAVIDGRPWLLAPSPTAILKRRDDRMYALPVVLPGNLRLYATAPQLPADAIPRLYFKAAPGEYRLVHLQPGA